MSTHKNFDKICCVIVALTLVLTVVFMNGKQFGIKSLSREYGYESRIFSTDTVHTVDIVIDDWDSFLDNAMSEEYALCAVVIDNEAYKNVAIRTKGNTSLSQVQSYGNDRYSFKIEFDHYDSTKNYYGLDKLVLNNLIQDNTYMKDYLSYRLMYEMGADAPLCSFAYLTVNGEDWGLYLAVEGIEESFLERNYGSDYGDLYKPESAENGGGNKGEMPDTQNGEMPDMQNGEMPTMQNGEMPDMQNGEMPTMQNGEMPDMQNGEMPDTQNGEMPTTQNGEMPNMQNGEMPDMQNGEMPNMQNGEMPNMQNGEMPNMQNGEMPNMSEGRGDKGNFGGKNSDFKDFSPDDMPEDTTMPENGFAGQGNFGGGDRGFSGSSGDTALIYSDDSYDSYSNIFNNAKTDVTDSDKDRLIASLKALNENENIENVVDTDEVIRYFAVHNFVCNFDSYTGSIIHNYYLYEKDGKMSMIPWDYNLAFGGFQDVKDASQLVNYPIDSPVSNGTVESRPMLSWIFADEEYTELYHGYLSELVSFDFEKIVSETISLISPYVEKDPTAFCSYDEFVKGSQNLKDFCVLRAQSVAAQLEGTIPSTSEGQNSDSSSLIDASGIDISSMGSMNNSMNGNDRGGKGDMQLPENDSDRSDPEQSSEFVPFDNNQPGMTGEDVPAPPMEETRFFDDVNSV